MSEGGEICRVKKIARVKGGKEYLRETVYNFKQDDQDGPHWEGGRLKRRDKHGEGIDHTNKLDISDKINGPLSWDNLHYYISSPSLLPITAVLTVQGHNLAFVLPHLAAKRKR